MGKSVLTKKIVNFVDFFLNIRNLPDSPSPSKQQGILSFRAGTRNPVRKHGKTWLLTLTSLL